MTRGRNQFPPSSPGSGVHSGRKLVLRSMELVPSDDQTRRGKILQLKLVAPEEEL